MIWKAGRRGNPSVAKTRQRRVGHPSRPAPPRGQNQSRIEGVDPTQGLLRVLRALNLVSALFQDRADYPEMVWIVVDD